MITFFAKAQSDQKIGISVTPSYSYRTLSGSDYRGMISSRNGYEFPRMGYAIGLNYEKRIGQKFSFKGGLHFADRGYLHQEESFTFASNIAPEYGFTYNNKWDQQIESLKVIYRHFYLDIPLRAQYHFSGGQWSFRGFAGVSPNIFLGYQNKSIKKMKDGSREVNHYSETNTNFEHVIIQGLIGGGVGYQLNDRIQFSAEPIIRISMSSFVDEPIKGYFWSAGLEVGAYYHF